MKTMFIEDLKRKIKRVLFVVINIFVLLGCNINAEDNQDDNHMILPDSNREFAICAMTITPGNCLFLAMNIRDNGVWNSSLFIVDNDHWHEEKLSTSGIAGVGLTSWNGKVYVVYQQPKATICKICDKINKEHIIQIGNINSEPFFAISANQNYITVSYEVLEYYKKCFLDFEKQSRQKVFVSLFDTRLNKLKNIRLTPKGINHDGWGPLLAKEQYNNCTHIYCLEKIQHGEKFETNLFKYEITPKGKTTKVQIYTDIQDYDLFDGKGNTYIVVETNSNDIKLLVNNHNSLISTYEIGKGNDPKLVQDTAGNIHIVWRKKSKYGISLVQRTFTKDNISEESIIINDIGYSRFYDWTGHRKMGESFIVCAIPDAYLYVIWENDGHIFGKNFN